MVSRLFTIGYEKTKPQDFLDTLQREKVTHLIDRAIAWSRRREFAQSALAQSLEVQNISYAHMKALGNPVKVPTAADKNQKPYPGIFLDHLQTTEAQEALTHVQELMATAAPYLFCLERNSLHYHRSIVTAGLGPGVQTIHLIPGQLI